MPSFQTTFCTSPCFPLLFLFLITWILWEVILIVSTFILIFLLIVPWLETTFFLAFCFLIVLLYLTILSYVWTVRCKMPFLITSVTDNFWHVIVWICCICVVFWGSVLTTYCWLWWFRSRLTLRLTLLLTTGRTLSRKMSWLLTTVTDNSSWRVICCWRWIWVWVFVYLVCLNLQNTGEVVMFLHGFRDLLEPCGFPSCQLFINWHHKIQCLVNGVILGHQPLSDSFHILFHHSSDITLGDSHTQVTVGNDQWGSETCRFESVVVLDGVLSLLNGFNMFVNGTVCSDVVLFHCFYKVGLA